MKFDIITIFSEVLKKYFSSSILGRAQKDKKIEIKLHNLRDFAEDKHKKVDDKPYGGGPGMVLKIEPVALATGSILRKLNLKNQISKFKKIKIILFSPEGKQFTQKMAKDWAKKYDNLIMICGRYEGVDERVKKVIKNLKLKIENLSIGPYILTGGELPAAVVADAVARPIPNGFGKEESLEKKKVKSTFSFFTIP